MFVKPRKNLMGAWKSGFITGFRGLPESHCPYLDKKQKDGRKVTFSRAFVRWWRKGWREGDFERGKLISADMKDRQFSLFEETPSDALEAG